MLKLVILDPQIVKMLSDDCTVWVSHKGGWPIAVSGFSAKRQQRESLEDVTVWPLRRPGKLARTLAWLVARVLRARVLRAGKEQTE